MKMRFRTTLPIAILLIVLSGCNQTGNNNSVDAQSDSITIKKIDSIKSLLIHLHSRVEFADPESLSIITHGILLSNQQLLELIPMEQYLEFSGKVKKGDISKKLNELDQNTKKFEKEMKKGMVWIGMTDKEAIWSVGKPDKVNKTVYSSGTEEQWVYTKKDLYLYFSDGILTSYQE